MSNTNLKHFNLEKCCSFLNEILIKTSVVRKFLLFLSCDILNFIFPMAIQLYFTSYKKATHSACTGFSFINNCLRKQFEVIVVGLFEYCCHNHLPFPVDFAQNVVGLLFLFFFSFCCLSLITYQTARHNHSYYHQYHRHNRNNHYQPISLASLSAVERTAPFHYIYKQTYSEKEYCCCCCFYLLRN